MGPSDVESLVKGRIVHSERRSIARGLPERPSRPRVKGKFAGFAGI